VPDRTYVFRASDDVQISVTVTVPAGGLNGQYAVADPRFYAALAQILADRNPYVARGAIEVAKDPKTNQELAAGPARDVKPGQMTTRRWAQIKQQKLMHWEFEGANPGGTVFKNTPADHFAVSKAIALEYTVNRGAGYKGDTKEYLVIGFAGNGPGV